MNPENQRLEDELSFRMFHLQVLLLLVSGSVVPILNRVDGDLGDSLRGFQRQIKVQFGIY